MHLSEGYCINDGHTILRKSMQAHTAEQMTLQLAYLIDE